jgi:cytochrome c
MMPIRRFLITAAALMCWSLNTLADGCDMDRGGELFLQCAACHTYLAENYDKSGPNLHGLFGRKAGTARYSFGYTDAMKASGLVWNEKTLDRFLQSPAKGVPGTKMVYVGLADPVDRATLICFLQKKTGSK